jgi:hypothetical protein
MPSGRALSRKRIGLPNQFRRRAFPFQYGHSFSESVNEMKSPLAHQICRRNAYRPHQAVGDLSPRENGLNPVT